MGIFSRTNCYKSTLCEEEYLQELARHIYLVPLSVGPIKNLWDLELPCGGQFGLMGKKERV